MMLSNWNYYGIILWHAHTTKTTKNKTETTYDYWIIDDCLKLPYAGLRLTLTVLNFHIVDSLEL